MSMERERRAERAHKGREGWKSGRISFLLLFVKRIMEGKYCWGKYAPSKPLSPEIFHPFLLFVKRIKRGMGYWREGQAIGLNEFSICQNKMNAEGARK